MKEVGKIIRPFRSHLDQIPYDYRVEVTNRFKGLELIERIPESYGQRFVTLYRRQYSKPYPKKKYNKAKWLSEEALQISEK